MAMGNLLPLPQPTGYFDLQINQKKVGSFQVTKYKLIWEGIKGIRFCFLPKRLEVAPPGESFCLDSVMTKASYATFGLGFLRVPLSLVSGNSSVDFGVLAHCPVPSQLFLGWIKCLV